MIDSGFFKTKMPSSRQADYYLGYNDGSVFIDFNLSEDKRIYLKRISFDGYGCCELRRNDNRLSFVESRKFINQMNSAELDQNIVQYLVNKLIVSNSEEIWEDAVYEYGLL